MDKRWLVDKQKLLSEILKRTDGKCYLTLKEAYDLIDSQETYVVVDGQVIERKEKKNGNTF